MADYLNEGIINPAAIPGLKSDPNSNQYAVKQDSLDNNLLYQNKKNIQKDTPPIQVVNSQK